jgi:hypothetical protein
MKKTSQGKAFKPQELEDFCINDESNAKRFPQGTSQRRAFIFGHTGYAAKPMNWHGWHCFNASMNAGLDIGLPTGGPDRTLMMLSLMDHALGEVPRFVGVKNMPLGRGDSTAAHSKQTMNIIQTVFENSGLLQPNSPNALRSETNTLRRDALLGAWIHDMGETIFELTTVDDMASMSKEDAAAIKKKKDVLEERIFEFSCQLAFWAIEQDTPELFHKTIQQIRKAALTPDTQIFTRSNDARSRISARMDGIKQEMERIKTTFDLPQELAPETKKLMETYHRTEQAGSFLNSFVKTLECVEGLRYLQRNSAESATEPLARQLAPKGQYIPSVPRELASDYEIVSSIQRAEKRLPDLFNNAKNTDERKLAQAAASFTYRSIARQFTPEPQDHVGLAPAIIDRRPEPPKVKNKTVLSAKAFKEVKSSREKDMDFKKLQLEKQDPEDFNVQYMTRERIGTLYRAAEDLVKDSGFPFIPKTTSLISINDTPTIPEALATEMKKRESQGIHVTRLGEKEPSGPGPEL